jgi:hypothetical protein
MISHRLTMHPNLRPVSAALDLFPARYPPTHPVETSEVRAPITLHSKNDDPDVHAQVDDLRVDRECLDMVGERGVVSDIGEEEVVRRRREGRPARESESALARRTVKIHAVRDGSHRLTLEKGALRDTLRHWPCSRCLRPVPTATSQQSSWEDTSRLFDYSSAWSVQATPFAPCHSPLPHSSGQSIHHVPPHSAHAQSSHHQPPPSSREVRPTALDCP